MRLRELRDIYLGQDIYIVGSGPTLNLFPLDFFTDKICLSLNDAYKKNPALTPITLMNSQHYIYVDNKPNSPYHEHFKAIKYPIVKPESKYKIERIDWDHPYFYYFKRSTKIHEIYQISQMSDVLYYSPEGCALHPALQVAWIMGAQNIFVIGCDSCSLGKKHYANFDKGGLGNMHFKRNYDSYVYGTLIIQDFLKTQKVNVFNLSPIVGYHRIEEQFQVLSQENSFDIFT